MPLNHEWQSRIKAVEREYAAMRQAANRLRDAARADPTILDGSLRKGLDEALTNLEGTYIIRLFTEFEAGARQYWGAIRDTTPTTVDLLNGLAARRKIPDTERDNAHLVREYRNALVHEREEEPEVVPIAAARSHLCRFFGFLPQRW